MIVKPNIEQEKLESALELMELTQENQKTARVWLDLSVPEDPELLKKVEHQDFSRRSKGVHKDIYCKFFSYIREKNKPLAERFIRLVFQIGGSTAANMLAFYGYSSDFSYTGKFLSSLENAVLQAEYIAWHDIAFCEKKFQFLVEMGKNDPEVLIQMMEYCYSTEAANTKMFLTAMYLHSVKPLKDVDSCLRLPAEEGDTRAKADPSRIQEMRSYLEQRLIGNVSGLFAAGDEPEEGDLECLKEFVRQSDPDQPIPPEILAILSGRKKSYYLFKFLLGLAFLAVEHSDRFVAMVRLAMAMEQGAVTNMSLNICRDMGETWFVRHLEELEKRMPISESAYLQWAVPREESQVVLRIVRRSPDTVRQVLEVLDTKYFGYLAARIKEGDLALYEEMKGQMLDAYQKAAAGEITESFQTAQKEAEQYLLGERTIADILPHVEAWRGMYLYGYQRDRQIHSYRQNGLLTLYKRVLVLECLRLSDGYFRLYWLDDQLEKEEKKSDYRRIIDERQIEGILKLLEEEGVPVAYQLEFFGAVYGHFYNYDNQSVYRTDTGMRRCAKVLAAVRRDWEKEYEAAAKGKSADVRSLALMTLDVIGESSKEAILSCAGDSAKQVRTLLRSIYTEHRDWESDILGLLQAKKASIREMAALVLKDWGAEHYREALTRALEKEKSRKGKELLQEILELEGQKDKDQTLEERIKEILSGGRKRRLAWYLDNRQMTVHRTDGSEVPEDHLAAFLTLYGDMDTPGVNEEAVKLSAGFYPEELSAFVKEVYEIWLESGAPAKRKWVLYAVSIHGGDGIVPVLYGQIQQWAKKSRGIMAAEAVKALALNGTPTALLQVDQIARKFRYDQVREAAEKALSFAAEQLGVTKDELEDRIVPDLGFDRKLERTFDYGPRKFQVVLTSALTLEVYDEKGKLLKNLPAPGKKDDALKAKASYDAWKVLKKQLKTVVAGQTLRMEQALGQGRLWTTEAWKALFVENPVMQRFASGLIWGSYTGDVLTETFRYLEDGSFTTVEEEVYTLPKEGMIGLVHPVELSRELLAAWKEQLEDYEIQQPVLQLHRPVYLVTEEEKEHTRLTRFDGCMLNGLSLSGKLLNMGWYRGEILDGGAYYTFERPDPGVTAELEFSGCGVGCEDEEVTMGVLRFLKPGTMTKEYGMYRPECYPLKELNPKYFSEILLQIGRAASSARHEA